MRTQPLSILTLMRAAALTALCAATLSAQWTAIKAPEKRLASNYVKALTLAGDVLYAATDQGINFMALTRDSAGSLDTKTLPKGVVNDLKAIGDTLWIASTAGVAAYNLRTGLLSPIPTEKSGIANAVKCITPDDDDIWFGTDGGGAFVFTRSNGAWERISKNSGLSSDNLRAILVHGDSVIFGTNTMGLSIFSRKGMTWTTLDRYDGLSNNNINALFHAREKIYACTYRGLSVFDPHSDDIKSFTKENGLFDDMILSGTVDGHYLWLGGMAGLSCFDLISSSFTVYTAKDGVPEDFITGLAVFGNLLYIATDGKGIVVFDKGTPSAQIDRVEFKGRTGTIYGSALSLNALSEPKFYFYTRTLPNMRFDKGIKVLGQGPGAIGSWDISGIIDGTYVLELAVKTDKGNENSAIVEINTDSFDPELTLEEPPSYTNKKKLTISGAFRERNVARILLYPGPVTAIVDPAKRTFQGTVELTPGRNNVRALILDRNGQSMEAKRTVFFSIKEAEVTFTNLPEFTREKQVTVAGRVISEAPLKELSLFPGSQPVNFDKTTRTFQIFLNLPAPGDNLFILKITDLSGNTTSKKINIWMDNSGPEIKLGAIPEFTADTAVTLTGTILDDHLKDIAVIPGLAPVAFDTASKKFSITRRLREGKNIFIVSAMDQLGNANQATVTVSRDIMKPRLLQPEIPGLVREPYFTLKGKYDEDNIASIRIDPGGTEAVLDTRNYSYAARLRLNNGDNPLTVIATDKAGNACRQNISVPAMFSDADKSFQTLRAQIDSLTRTIDSLQKSLKGRP